MVVHFKLVVCAIAVTLLATLALGSRRQDVQSTKKPYVQTGQEGSLAGTVTLTGTRPKSLVIDMSADPSCYKDNPHPKTEWFAGRKGKLANVLVYVTSEVLDTYSFEQPDEAVVLQHKGCRYEPHVLGMRVGQALSIENLDGTHNNTHPTPKNNIEWNQTQPLGSPPIWKSFQRAEVSIPFKDNQHPWKKAYVSVFSHPFFAVTDVDGNFSIQGIPPGSYKIIAWHERLGEKSVDLVFASGESRYLVFEFSAADSQ